MSRAFASEPAGRLPGMGVDRLRDELLREPAPAWRPQRGDVLIGEVVAIDERRGFAERLYPIVTVLENETGKEVAFHAFHTVAKDEILRLEPKVGDTIGIAYLGLVEKEDSRYELYRVKVIRKDVVAAGFDPIELAAPEPMVEPEKSLGGDDIPF